MSEDRWSEAIERMLVRIDDTASRVTKEFPHWADPETGQWTTTPHGDWTGGFWGGMLWLAATATGRWRLLCRQMSTASMSSRCSRCW